VPLDPATQNVQPQFPRTSLTDPTFSIQYANDTVREVVQYTYPQLQHAIPYYPYIPPRTTVASFDHTIRAAQWRQSNGMGSLNIKPMWPPMVVPALPQPIPPQSLMTALTPLWLEVPQRLYKHREKQPDPRPRDPIYFSVDNCPGINLERALRRRSTHLDGWDDPIFRNISTKAITCRFLFPGYADGSAQISTLDWRKTRGSINRSKLAYEVAKKLDRYLESIAGQAMEGSVDQQWRVGEGFMFLRNMYLVRLLSVSTGSYQPEVWVRTR